MAASNQRNDLRRDPPHPITRRGELDETRPRRLGGGVGASGPSGSSGASDGGGAPKPRDPAPPGLPDDAEDAPSRTGQAPPRTEPDDTEGTLPARRGDPLEGRRGGSPIEKQGDDDGGEPGPSVE